jgi:microcompartment protein CcmK/EutM
MPSDSDPLFQRVKAVRVREQLFVDKLQQNYLSFSQHMNNSYLVWQEASFTEMQLRQEAKKEGIYKTIGGVLLIALAIAAGVSRSSNVALDTAAILGGMGGAVLISSGFKSREEEKIHQDAINELGESINLELESQVISFEDQTVELTGNIQQQFAQWRKFLQRIYEQELTPNTEL